ncbi:hypothetical protein chiPu_0020412 [Chiloscyllium punctatum]|uniref:Uncharacterized protein n=1 Tax=Chiloscyllium punctatum TaxID=137246 RepID=A0A401RFC7_CHIPU|nr:hypothetical protein [Chiloscyllium punctatum]
MGRGLRFPGNVAPPPAPPTYQLARTCACPSPVQPRRVPTRHRPHSRVRDDVTVPPLPPPRGRWSAFNYCARSRGTFPLRARAREGERERNSFPTGPLGRTAADRQRAAANGEAGCRAAPLFGARPMAERRGGGTCRGRPRLRPESLCLPAQPLCQGPGLGAAAAAAGQA